MLFLTPRNSQQKTIAEAVVEFLDLDSSPSNDMKETAKALVLSLDGALSAYSPACRIECESWFFVLETLRNRARAGDLLIDNRRGFSRAECVDYATNNLQDFALHVSKFVEHHHNDGAWGDLSHCEGSIYKEIDRIRSMDHIGSIYAVLAPVVAFDSLVSSFIDQSIDPEELREEEVLQLVIEFAALSTPDGRSFGCLDSSEVYEFALNKMSEDPAYAQRFTDRARKIVADRFLDIAVTAAS